MSTETRSDGLKIVRLSVKNVMRVKAVEFEARGANMVVVSGRNEAGKSSVLDAIAMALGGRALIPVEPLRRGEKQASIELDLDEYKVVRTFTTKGSSLTVTSREGASYPSPQSFLNGLIGKISFDPLAFAFADEAEQATILRALAHIDTSDLDERRKLAYDERTLVNREIKTLEGALAKAPRYGDVGLDPVSADHLTAALQRADAEHDAVARQAAHLVAVQGAADRATRDAERASAAVDTLRTQLVKAEAALEEAVENAAIAQDELATRKAALAQQQASLVDRDDLRQQFAAIEDTNRRVAANVAYRGLEEQMTAKSAEVDRLTSTINSCDVEKQERLDAAVFPIDGLALSPTGAVVWNGIPFSQASTAVKTKVSVSIGMALNPKLRILLVRNGNDLDDGNVEVLATMAREMGGQFFVERVVPPATTPGDVMTLVIEEGEVRA